MPAEIPVRKYREQSGKERVKDHPPGNKIEDLIIKISFDVHGYKVL